MKMQYYKTYMGIGAAIIIIALSLVGFDASQSFQHSYVVLYNRVYFVLLYLLIFLLGMIPIASKLFIPEAAIRFSGKFLLVLSLHKQTFFYALFYTGIFTAANLLVTLVFNSSIYFTSSQYYIFLLMAFLFQVVGWFLAGSVFLTFYALLRNIVFAYLAVVLSIITSTSIAVSDTFSPIRYYLSIHEFMYLFFEMGHISKMILYMTYYCLLSAAFLWIMYKICSKSDLLSRMKGG